ncbi:hypothetical protein E2C01_057851 [Portunus trituberculatus]|uniref:Uncharacterized protein n=1 Tax=Portunus trituberculatus TaxID=210409 RepID=A0A5B7H3S1_PORTR|nr:hypothetical protein [Portunus trituberculatus]
MHYTRKLKATRRQQLLWHYVGGRTLSSCSRWHAKQRPTAFNDQNSNHAEHSELEPVAGWCLVERAASGNPTRAYYLRVEEPVEFTESVSHISPVLTLTLTWMGVSFLPEKNTEVKAALAYKGRREVQHVTHHVHHIGLPNV